MALGYLKILIIVLLVMSILGIILLFTNKNKTIKNILFYFLVVLSVFVTYINATSLPTNYTLQMIISLLPILISIIAVIIKIKKPEKMNIAYVILTVSVLITNLLLLGVLKLS